MSKKKKAMIKDEGGPAFPINGPCEMTAAEITKDGTGIIERISGFSGMTMRDYFAGQALAGAVTINWSEESDLSTISKGCYAMADAMLKARKVL